MMRMPLLAFGVGLWVSFIQPTGEATAAVVFNEIAYHPITDSSSEEYIELYNSGLQPVDLSGWTVDGVGYTFPPSTLLAPDGFLVLAKDPSALAVLFPGLTGVLGPYSGHLQNSGERIQLLDGSQAVIDEVEYSDALPWPTAPDGDGPSLELRHPALENSRPENWAASDITYAPNSDWRSIDLTLNPVSGDFFFFMTDYDGSGWIGDADSIHILFDDFHLEDLAAPGINLISNGGFESGAAEGWNRVGTNHAGLATPEDAFSGKYCLHYWALDGGSPSSRAFRYQPDPAVNLAPDKTYRFTARYKVIHGGALMSVGAGSTVGAGPLPVEKLKVWGTPGASNSVLRSPETPAPVSFEPLSDKVLPNTPVEVVVQFNTVSRMGQAELHYSVQQIGFNGLGPTPELAVQQSIPLLPDAAPNSTTFRASIPGQAENSIIRYHLEWTDSDAERNRYPHVGSTPRNFASYVPGPAPDYGVPNYFLHLVPAYYDFFYEMLISGPLIPDTYGIFRFNRPTFPVTFIDLEDGRIYEDVAWKPRGWDNLHNAMGEGFRVGISLEFNSGFYYKGEKREIDINNNRSRRNEAGFRTRLAHEVYRRAGVPAPRTRYVWVNQNGVEMGLMLDIESPDDPWLARWGRDGAGSLYKARWSYRGPFFIQNNLLRANESIYSSLEDYEHCYLKKNRRSSNHSDLIAMIKALNAPALTGRVFQMASNGSDLAGQRGFFESQVDVENLLRKYGVDSVLANHDRGQQNHYLYQDASRDGRWETYPWDLDISWEIGTRDLWNTLGQFPGGGAIVEDPAFTPDWWFYQAEPSFTRLMAVPEYREAYVLGVREQLRTTFSERGLFPIIDDYAAEGFTAFERDKAVWPQVSGPNLFTIAQSVKDRVKRARQAAFWRARTENLDGFVIPPVLSDGRTSPMVPSPSLPIEFRVNALSAGATNLSEGVAAVTLFYSLNGGPVQSSAMSRVSANSYDGDYSLSLPALPDGTVIEYWFTTLDDLGLVDRLPEQGGFQTEVVGDPTSAAAQVKITEIMYHSDLLGAEWVEIENTSDRPVDVSGWFLGDEDPAHRFRLPADILLAPGGRLVIAANELVVKEEYGVFNVVGDLDFNFGNAGDSVSLFDAFGALINEVVYTDQFPWPDAADGRGPSLELINSSMDNALPSNWRASLSPRGTPGQPNGTAGTVPRVVINECSYDPAFQGVVNDYNRDGVLDDSHEEFVELYNTTSQPIDLSGWTIDDDNPANGNTFTFPLGTVIPAGGFVVVFGGGAPTGFSVPTFTGLPRLGNGGDQVRLYDGAGEVDSLGYEDRAFGTLNNLSLVANGGSLARILDGDPEFEARESDRVTAGSTNNPSGGAAGTAYWRLH